MSDDSLADLSDLTQLYHINQKSYRWSNKNNTSQIRG